MEFDSWEDFEKWANALERTCVVVEDINIKGLPKGLVYPGRDSFVEMGLFYPERKASDPLLLSDGVDLSKESKSPIQ